jgi:predicted membrane-bound spermidine synthase
LSYSSRSIPSVEPSSRTTRRLLFLAFFSSGFAGLVYQIVWTRLAFASFGVISPVLSIVISVFMLGLSAGAWLGGKLVSTARQRIGWSALTLYGGAELLITFGAFAVPELFATGERLLFAAGETSSIRYLSLSAIVLTLSILPWCLFMGMTFPFMMEYVREREPGHSNSFSYLYAANVLGAMAGTLCASTALIELFGFRETLWIAATGNLTAAFIALRLARVRRLSPDAPLASSSSRHSADQATAPLLANWRTTTVLFTTGFSAMAMEVIWTRAFAPVLKTQVYSFALIVFVYLAATFLGSVTYRWDLRRGRVRPVADLLTVLAIVVLLPILLNDVRWLRADWGHAMHSRSVLLLLASIGPFCAVLGYLTPRLIDDSSGGNPAVAGNAYASNVLGCILGPLVASYGLLPSMSERHALLWVSLPFFVFYLAARKSLEPRGRALSSALICAALIWGVLGSHDYETDLLEGQPNTVIRRDYAASVISFGDGFRKNLLVNGIGMTILSPITKFMLHLPTALHRGRPNSALIICFGMGTTYRSALSWDLETTAVELVPSVRDAFGYYHSDAAQILRQPGGHIVIDDGRRYLNRSRRKFDIIVIDPPPPIETAGSSLLYSQEFYGLVKQHLNPQGILQAWFPYGSPTTGRAVVRSVRDSFPYVRCFRSVEGWGLHILASMEPIAVPSVDEIVMHMPENARKDLTEWAPSADLPSYLERVLGSELSTSVLIGPNPPMPITDDQPINEYFLLRGFLS